MRVLEEALQCGPDFAVLCGYRDEAAQARGVAKGASRLAFPRSKHNRKPSRAVDIAPWPIDWDDLGRFRLLAGHVLGVAGVLRVPLRWGGDWNRDFNERDERFRDLPHFELLDG